MKLKSLSLALAGAVSLTMAGSALAQKQYGPGVTDKEILIGGISPYSGPASAYGSIGKAISAYFDKVNAEGGVNGRKIKFISLDDGYNPAKTVEQARKLVEQEEVLLVFQSLGTPPNSAIHKYMNDRKVPQLFVATGATKWGDPKGFPWTMGWQPNYQSEAKIYAAHLLENHPNAKIAVLYQNDDYGKDYLKGFEDGLGDNGKARIVSKLSYEVTDPTVDSQMVSLKASGADVFFNITTPKFAAQAIKKAHELGWKPVHYLNSVSSAVGHRAGAGRHRGLHRRDDRRLHQGPDRPAVPEGQGMGRLRGLHEEVPPDRRDERQLQRLWLHGGADDGRGAEEGGRQPHARERHEAGRQPGPDVADVVAGCEHQDRSGRFLPDRA